MTSLRLNIIILILLICGTLKAQWLQTSGPNGGFVDDFAVNGSSIFIGTEATEGIFRSDDDGASWKNVGSGLPLTFGFPSAVAANAGFVFAGGYSLGIYRSSDNGISWVNIFIGTPVTKLHVHNGILFAGTYGAGVYRSTDNGNSFQHVSNGLAFTSNIRAFASSGDILFTGLSGNGGTVGVYVSYNNGDQWTQVINGLPSSPSTNGITANGTDIFAAISDKGIYKSTNNGASWSAVNTGLPIIINGGVNVVEASRGIIYAGMTAGFGAYKSTDNGANWISINNGLPVQPSTYSILIQDNYVLYGSQYAVYKTTNEGSSWFASYKGIANVLINDLATDGINIYAGSQSSNAGMGEGVSVTSDKGDNWHAANGGFSGNPTVNTIAINGSTMFTSTVAGVFKSTNEGVNWVNVNWTGSGASVVKILVHNNIVFVATYGYGIQKSTDNGITWEPANTGLGNDAGVYDLMVKGNDIYAGIFWGVYVSTNNGASWTNKSNGIYPGSSVYTLEKSGNNILAGTYRGLYLSSNNGSNWNAIETGPPKDIHDFVTSGTDTYAACDSGVYKSTDFGFTWTEDDNGLTPYIPATALLVLDNYLYVGTKGRGVWKRQLNNNLTLDLKVLIQGLYDPVSDKMVKDTVTVYLRNSSSPFSIADSSRSSIDSVGKGNFTFSNASPSASYYIVLKHRNALETWSSVPAAFVSGSLSYDFTTAASKAFGNNQILEGSRYAIYSGDINYDGFINVNDILPIYNGAISFATGYLITDLTGDKITNMSDVLIAHNNSVNFVRLRRP